MTTKIALPMVPGGFIVHMATVKSLKKSAFPMAGLTPKDFSVQLNG